MNRIKKFFFFNKFHKLNFKNFSNNINKNDTKTILITGSNKGLGYHTAKSLILKQINNNNKYHFNFLLTARNPDLGEKAIQELKDLVPKNIEDNNTNNSNNLDTKIDFLQLDISNKISIENCINYLKEKELKDNIKIDILLNNAGIINPNPMKINLEIFDKVMDINLFGTINLTEKILENNLLNNNGKLIFLSSKLGNEKRLKENIREKFLKENLNKDDIFLIAEQFRNSIEKKTYLKEGWGKHVYAMSKLVIKRYAYVLGENKGLINKNIQSYSCCPGWVRTDLGGEKAERSIDEGIKVIEYLINLDFEINKEYQGRFFEDNEVSEF